MGILRGVDLKILTPLIETIIASGLETIEITMNTDNAVHLIKTAKNIASGKLTIGAGTVLTVKQLNNALRAGATFIVMPTCTQKLVKSCLKQNIPVFPGALTPQEIYTAWGMGATMVKVFPARFFGPEYFKEIKGPFDSIELLACGGVTPENMRAYFTNGASAITFGASVFQKEWLAQCRFSHIAELIKRYIGNLPKEV